MEVPNIIFDSSDVSTPSYYSPAQTALLLLDFHNMFIQAAGGAKAPEALQVAVEMRKWAKSLGIHVIHAVVDVTKTPFPTCKAGKRLGGLLTMMQGDPGKEPNELVQDYGSDIQFTRTPGHVSALKSPGLDDYLKEKGIKNLILTGLSTSGCVMRTAVAATDAEYVVTVISDACADGKEGVHEAVLGVMSRTTNIATAAEFREGYEKGRGGK